MTDPFATFRTGFCLQTSGDGKHVITISYPTAADMHKAFDELAAALSTLKPEGEQISGETFQQEVDRWLIACFGIEIARDKVERNHRFLEEALELVQSGGCTASEAHQLVDYVYGRPVGEMHQEVGGVMNTLAALCLSYDLDMMECGNIEIARCWTKVEKIRAKHAAKPKHSPLPELPNERIK